MDLYKDFQIVAPGQSWLISRGSKTGSIKNLFIPNRSPSNTKFGMEPNLIYLYDNSQSPSVNVGPTPGVTIFA